MDPFNVSGVSFVDGVGTYTHASGRQFRIQVMRPVGWKRWVFLVNDVQRPGRGNCYGGPFSAATNAISYIDGAIELGVEPDWFTPEPTERERLLIALRKAEDALRECRLIVKYMER